MKNLYDDSYEMFFAQRDLALHGKWREANKIAKVIKETMGLEIFIEDNLKKILEDPRISKEIHKYVSPEYIIRFGHKTPHPQAIGEIVSGYDYFNLESGGKIIRLGYGCPNCKQNYFGSPLIGVELNETKPEHFDIPGILKLPVPEGAFRHFNDATVLRCRSKACGYQLLDTIWSNHKYVD